MERLKELGFGLVSIAVGCANFGVFTIIWLKGAVYVYENIRWILYLEWVVCLSYLIWAVERFLKDIKHNA